MKVKYVLIHLKVTILNPLHAIVCIIFMKVIILQKQRGSDEKHGTVSGFCESLECLECGGHLLVSASTHSQVPERRAFSQSHRWKRGISIPFQIIAHVLQQHAEAQEVMPSGKLSPNQPLQPTYHPRRPLGLSHWKATSTPIWCCLPNPDPFSTNTLRSLIPTRLVHPWGASCRPEASQSDRAETYDPVTPRALWGPAVPLGHT